ncbi:MAG: hypothetical protein JWP67_2027 [Mucilaginibacter sp.]|nr:hypothetical protein [Mucilaginibacter sp.]
MSMGGGSNGVWKMIANCFYKQVALTEPLLYLK